MKIVSWNCHCSYGKGLTLEKVEAIQKYAKNADILVIQEVSKTECDHKNIGDLIYGDWYGDGKNGEPGGVAIFSKAPYTVKRHGQFVEMAQFRYVLPYQITVTGKVPSSLTLIAVWTKEQIGNDGYHDHLFKALEYHKIDAGTPYVLIGDFNTGANSKNAWYKNLEDHLNAKQLYNCAKGEEKEELTFLGHRGHVIDDFCFASDEIAKKAAFKVITTEEFTKLSDHCPIIVNFDW